MLIAIVALCVLFLCLVGSFIGGVYAERHRGVPLWRVEDYWTIGIYAGESPLEVSAPEGVQNPVLTARDVTDLEASFVADPFMVREEGRWYMFFEVMPAESYLGKIGLASSADGWRWEYEQIVLDEPHHLSYPYVFKWEGEHYMIPDCYGGNAVRLYKATEFPRRWSRVGNLIEGNYVDASVVRHDGCWWLFAADPQGNHTLHLFSAETLSGSWAEHPQSPLVAGDPHIARPGGRVIVNDGRVFRFTQDDAPIYGNQLRAFEVTELSPTGYREQPAAQAPVLRASGSGWNRDGMHHIDPHQVGDRRWIACVDGNRQRLSFRLSY
jgi:hypothetical protein